MEEIKHVKYGDKFYTIFERDGIVSANTTKKKVEDFPNVDQRHNYVLWMAADQCAAQEDDWYWAVAKCDDRDEWDEKVGIDIAGEKLDLKNHTRLAKKYDQMHRLLMECATYCYAHCMHHYEKANKIEDDLYNYHVKEKE